MGNYHITSADEDPEEMQARLDFFRSENMLVFYVVELIQNRSNPFPIHGEIKSFTNSLPLAEAEAKAFQKALRRPMMLGIDYDRSLAITVDSKGRLKYFLRKTEVSMMVDFIQSNLPQQQIINQKRSNAVQKLNYLEKTAKTNGGSISPSPENQYQKFTPKPRKQKLLQTSLSNNPDYQDFDIDLEDDDDNMIDLNNDSIEG